MNDCLDKQFRIILDVTNEVYEQYIYMYRIETSKHPLHHKI